MDFVLLEELILLGLKDWIEALDNQFIAHKRNGVVGKCF